MTRLYDPPASGQGPLSPSWDLGVDDARTPPDDVITTPVPPAAPASRPGGSAGRRLASRRPLIQWVALAVIAVAAAALFIRQGAPPVAAASEFTVRRGDLHQVVAARGRLQPRAEIAVSAKMIGRVTSVYVNEGDRVTAGQLVAVMDDAELRAALAQADARIRAAAARFADVMAGARPQEIAAARAQVAEHDAVRREAATALQRFTELARAGLISASQLEEAQRRQSVAEAQQRSATERLAVLEAGARTEQKQEAAAELSQAESQRTLALAELDNARVVAPASGVVLRRYMEPGEVIVLQRPQPILTIADDTRVFVRAEVDEADIQRLRVDQMARVTAAGFDQEFIGRVAEIGRSAGRKVLASDDPSEIQDTRVVEVGIEMPTGVAWTFGTTAEVEIVVVDRSDVLIVPRNAVVAERNSDPYVRILSAGSVRQQEVGLGAADEAYVEIAAGLQAGDVILVPAASE